MFICMLISPFWYIDTVVHALQNDVWFNKSIMKVKVYINNPGIPEFSADFSSLTPSIWTHSFSLIALGRMQHIFCNWSNSHSTSFRSTWYLLLLVAIVHSELAWLELQESNPRPLDLGSNAFRPCSSLLLSNILYWKLHWCRKKSQKAVSVYSLRRTRR